jgi:hypothetical protein
LHLVVEVVWVKVEQVEQAAQVQVMGEVAALDQQQFLTVLVVAVEA